MPIICHRINTIEELRAIPESCGVEIDVRFDTRTGELYLHHDNCGPGEIEHCNTLDGYLKQFVWNPSRIVVFNIKDSGSVVKKGAGKDVEWQCIALAERYGIPKSHYFLLDVEFPWLYYATRDGVREIAARYSEAECIEQVLLLKERAERERAGCPRWVWIDTNTKLPLDEVTIGRLSTFQTCLVCPERWGRPGDIPLYANMLKGLGARLDAVMTNVKYVDQWRETGVIRDHIPVEL